MLLGPCSCLWGQSPGTWLEIPFLCSPQKQAAWSCCAPGAKLVAPSGFIPSADPLCPQTGPAARTHSRHSVPSTKAAQAVLTRPSCVSEPPVPSQTCRGSISVFLPSPQVLQSSLGANVAQARAQALRCVGTSCGAQREQSHSPRRMLSVGACRGAHPGFI